jgi:hypothetical protein
VQKSTDACSSKTANVRFVPILLKKSSAIRPTATLAKETQAAAQALQLDLQIPQVRPDLIADTFSSVSKEKTDGIVVQQTASLNAHIRQIADLAPVHRRNLRRGAGGCRLWHGGENYLYGLY